MVRTDRSRLGALALALSLGAPVPGAQTLFDSSLVDMVPAGFPVAFGLLTQGARQYAAYYDKDHAMTVALRTLGSGTWSKQVLPTKVEWDSHNYVTMALDRKGNLHVSGNMHTVPLIYFRSAAPYDIKTLARVPNMVSAARENSVTYPNFVKTPQGDLYFYYRQGSSGDGLWYFDKYDENAAKWSASYGGNPLFGNQGSVNAYFTGPTLGPDGRFHVFFMWRDTPDASTCHHAGYIRSRAGNLDAWETANGTPLTLPVTSDNQAMVVDPSPVKQGLINMGFAIGFDARQRAILSYHRYAADGNSEIYNARWSAESKQWQVVQASPWKDYRWNFGGGGSIASEIGSGPVTLKKGKLVQTWWHAKHGAGEWTLDEGTLLPVATRILSATGPTQISPTVPVERQVCDYGAGADSTLTYCLRWKTLDANRDVKPAVVPPDGRLEILTYRSDETVSLPAPAPRPQGGKPGSVSRALGRWFPYAGSRFDARGRPDPVTLP